MNLKKHISTLLTFLILASNMGLALNVHYCHGEVASVSFAYKLQESCRGHHEAETETKACCAADEGHKHCCENDLVKLQDDANNDNILVKSNFHCLPPSTICVSYPILVKKRWVACSGLSKVPVA